jgi:hypothetical protein
MNRKINRRTRRMATQVIDFNPNDIYNVNISETTGGNLCKTDQNQFNSQISNLLKRHETKVAENKESVNCESKNVIKEDKKHETNKQEQINSNNSNDKLVSHKAIAAGVLKSEENKVVSKTFCKKEATERKDVIKQSTNNKEKIKNNTMSTIIVDRIPTTTSIGVEQRQFAFKDLLNKFKKIESESFKRFEKKTSSELTNLDLNETVETKRIPVNVNQRNSVTTNIDSIYSLRRPVEIAERAFDFKKLMSIFNK